MLVAVGSEEVVARAAVDPVLAVLALDRGQWLRSTTTIQEWPAQHTRVLARKGGGTFENSVKIGKLGPIEIKGGNIGDWVAKKDPEDLVVTSTKGKQSDELKRMSDSRERIDTIEVQSIVGENSFVVITFSHARIKGYAADPSGNTEQWKVVDFDAVHRAKTSIGAARP